MVDRGGHGSREPHGLYGLSPDRRTPGLSRSRLPTGSRLPPWSEYTRAGAASSTLRSKRASTFGAYPIRKTRSCSATIKPAELGTHRNYYDGGRYVHATALPAGYDGHIYQVVDISDPTKPKEISRWWRKGQWVGGGEAGVPFGTMLHGGAHVNGSRAFLPYSAGGFVILDISDINAPKLVGDLPFSPPFQSFIAVHSAVPLTKRKLVVVNSEAIAENCDEPLGYAGIVDVADETHPRLISLFPLPRPPEDAPFRNFCERGGRFGPHNQHHHSINQFCFRTRILCS